MHLNKIVYLGLILILTSLVSCVECKMEYDEPKELEINNTNSNGVLKLECKQWNGEFNYLSLALKILNCDSCLVKDIKIEILKSDAPFPLLYQYNMRSFYYQGNNLYWKDYLANSFDSLPTENRITEFNDIPIEYTFYFKSKDQITVSDFEIKLTSRLQKNDSIFEFEKKYFFTGNEVCKRKFMLH